MVRVRLLSGGGIVEREAFERLVGVSAALIYPKEYMYTPANENALPDDHRHFSWKDPDRVFSLSGGGYVLSLSDYALRASS